MRCQDQTDGVGRKGISYEACATELMRAVGSDEGWSEVIGAYGDETDYEAESTASVIFGGHIGAGKSLVRMSLQGVRGSAAID